MSRTVNAAVVDFVSRGRAVAKQHSRGALAGRCGIAEPGALSVSSAPPVPKTNPPSSASASALRGSLYVVSAPSGAGKTSLVKALMERDASLRFSVSYTTRKPRPNEVDARDYHFVTPERFREMIERGDFLEHASVFDNHYGTGLHAVKAALERGERLLLEIDWQGARQVKQRLPEAQSIFILPPSRRALEERLRQRSTDSDAVIARRLQDSVGDLAHWTEFDFVVTNDRFERALADIEEIIAGRGQALGGSRPEIARLAADLLRAAPED